MWLTSPSPTAFCKAIKSVRKESRVGGVANGGGLRDDQLMLDAVSRDLLKRELHFRRRWDASSRQEDPEWRPPSPSPSRINPARLEGELGRWPVLADHVGNRDFRSRHRRRFLDSDSRRTKVDLGGVTALRSTPSLSMSSSIAGLDGMVDRLAKVLVASAAAAAAVGCSRTRLGSPRAVAPIAWLGVDAGAPSRRTRLRRTPCRTRQAQPRRGCRRERSGLPCRSDRCARRDCRRRPRRGR